LAVKYMSKVSLYQLQNLVRNAAKFHLLHIDPPAEVDDGDENQDQHQDKQVEGFRAGFESDMTNQVAGVTDTAAASGTSTPSSQSKVQTNGLRSQLTGLKSVPADQVIDFLQESRTPKDFPIVMICETGQLCAQVAHILEQEQYKNVFVVDGGWVQLLSEFGVES
jgi:rhodanese-related sulfurtransferase